MSQVIKTLGKKRKQTNEKVPQAKRSNTGKKVTNTLKQTNRPWGDYCYDASLYKLQNQELLSLLKEPVEVELSRESHPPNPQNMVFTVSMGDGFSPREISSHFLQTEYKPKQFAAVVCRIRDPYGNTTVLIFSTGKMVCVGGKTEEEVITQLQKYRRILGSCGYRTDFSDLTLHNLVCNAHVGHPIDIKTLSEKDTNNTAYNPDLFPGAIKMVYLLNGSNVIILVFDTGNIICMGLKTFAEAIEAMSIIMPILALYKSDKVSIDSKKKPRPPKPTPQSRKKTTPGQPLPNPPTQSEPKTTATTATTTPSAPQPKQKPALLNITSLISRIKTTKREDIPSLLEAISKGNVEYLCDYVKPRSKKKTKTEKLVETDIPDISDLG